MRVQDYTILSKIENIQNIQLFGSDADDFNKTSQTPFFFFLFEMVDYIRQKIEELKSELPNQNNFVREVDIDLGGLEATPENLANALNASGLEVSEDEYYLFNVTTY